MVKVEAWSLEEAYMLASERLGCSITEIEYEVAQAPSKGFLGIGRKKAVLVAVKKHSVIKVEEKRQEPIESHSQESMPKQPKQEKKIERKDPVYKAQEQVKEKPIEVKEPTTVALREAYFEKTEIEDNFFRETRDIKEICEEIEVDVNNLFACSCFDLERIRVEPFDKETALVMFSGQDSALLIGKEGYRYKALSYLIFNWINSKYDLLIRLEIAEFLKNQEEMIINYLEPLILQIKETRRGHTKVLDGVLIQIALKILREEFTELYVGVKTNSDGSKYIIVNEFYTKQNVR